MLSARSQDSFRKNHPFVSWRGLSIALTVVHFLLGCAGSGTQEANQRAQADAGKVVAPTEPVNEAEAARALEKGTRSIRGVVFTSQGRTVVIKKLINNKTFHRDAEVYLLPATPYVEAYAKWRAKHGSDGVRVNIAPEMQPYVRMARTDAYGRFSFEGLKAGHYYLVTSVYMPNFYTVDETVGTGSNQYGTTTYTRKRKVDTSYYLTLNTFVGIANDGQAIEAELNDY